MTSLIAMLTIVVTWLLLLAAICGIGLLISRLLGVDGVNMEMAFAAFWLGWSAILLLLQIRHFFAPIDLSALLVVAFLGVVLLPKNWTQKWLSKLNIWSRLLLGLPLRFKLRWREIP